jgi:hypothetical protein
MLLSYADMRRETLTCDGQGTSLERCGIDNLTIGYRSGGGLVQLPAPRRSMLILTAA